MIIKMKKQYLLVIICLLFINVAEVQSQELTFQETKDLLFGHKWFLRRFEHDGSMYTVPKDIQGLKRVFLNNGMSYSYLPSENEAKAEQHKWTITKTHITFYMYDEPQVYRYRVEDFIGYKLYLDLEGDDDMPTFVFEKAEKVDPTKLVSNTAPTELNYEQIKTIEKKIYNTSYPYEGPKASKEELVNYLSTLAKNTIGKKIYKASSTYFQESWITVNGSSVKYFIKQPVGDETDIQSLEYHFDIKDISQVALVSDDNAILQRITLVFREKPCTQYYKRPSYFKHVAIDNEKEIYFFFDTSVADMWKVQHAFNMLINMSANN